MRCLKGWIDRELAMTNKPIASILSLSREIVSTRQKLESLTKDLCSLTGSSTVIEINAQHIRIMLLLQAEGPLSIIALLRELRAREPIEMARMIQVINVMCRAGLVIRVSRGVYALNEQSKLRSIRLEIEAKLRTKRADAAKKTFAPSPRYDEVFFDGVKTLNRD